MVWIDTKDAPVLANLENNTQAWLDDGDDEENYEEEHDGVLAQVDTEVDAEIAMMLEDLKVKGNMADFINGIMKPLVGESSNDIKECLSKATTVFNTM